MAVDVRWYEEGYIIHQKFQKTISLDDFRDASNASGQLVKSANISGKVYFVLDFTDVEKITATVTRVSYPRELALSDDHMGWSVIVCPIDSMMREQVAIISQVLKYMFNHRFFIADTLPEGIAFLADKDDRLQGLLDTPPQE